MPLHDWTEDQGWDGVHHYWLTYIAEWLRPRLPEGFRPYLGSVPSLDL